jgi:hypothetical protein
VTLHINNTPKAIFTVLDSLHTLYTSTPKASTHVDVHLIIDSFDRQFNTWRNIARLFARTSFVMMLDVDFALCTDFRTSIRSSKAVMDKLKGGRVALVVPAFEYVNRSEGMNQSTFPRDKEVCTSSALCAYHPHADNRRPYALSSKPVSSGCSTQAGQ